LDVAVTVHRCLILIWFCAGSGRRR
jgi:hypothetical protein